MRSPLRADPVCGILPRFPEHLVAKDFAIYVEEIRAFVYIFVSAQGMEKKSDDVCSEVGWPLLRRPDLDSI